MSEPRYARFYKADLQMQTPVDRRHWLGDALPPDPSAEDLADAARAYARRCYEVGLEIVGITDHNMGGGAATSFVPHLEAAVQELADEYGYEIVVFPGFEVAGPIGKGAHLLCLFEPGTTPNQVSEKLTRLGLGEACRFKKGEPSPVTPGDCTFEKMLDLIQGDPAIPGLCILAHPTSVSGAMDNRTVAQWWSQDVIKNDALLCMELPWPRDEKLEEAGDSLVKNILKNKDPRYERRHPIATICSSDCKRLEPDEEHRNYIGYRHTWIKMSQPSIEGLRQAFLDHESRIRFGDQRPEDGFGYPKITRFEVSGAAFLEDQEIVFSPNMTNLIGGGGTGKSTIIEYMRAVAGQDAAIQGGDVRRNHERALATASRDTRIEIEIERDGSRWTLESFGGSQGAVTHGESIPDLPRFFPLRVYGQREIYAIAEDRRARARLVDNLVRSKLDALEQQAAEAITEIRHLDEEILRREELERRRDVLATEQLDLKTKLQRLREFEEPLRAWKGAVAEQRFLEDAREEVRSRVGKLLEELDELELSSTALGSGVDAWPHADGVRAFAARLDELFNAAQDDLREWLRHLETQAGGLLSSSEVAAWQEHFEAAKRAYEEMRDSLAEQDADPEQYLAYERELKRVADELKAIDDRIEGIEERRASRRERLDELLAIWRRETEVRTHKAAELRDRVPATDAGPPFVEVEVHGFGDHASFVELMDEFVKDRRRISDDDWKDLLTQASERTLAGQPPTTTLVQWVAALRQGEDPEGFPWADDRRRQTLVEWLDEATCARVELIRVPDRVVVRLNRQDGSAAGELEGGLSVGQRCTAILALLLTDDDAPVIIDQPEDEIDNEFIYRELVPMLRRVKEERQVVIATHDPNLPVNGDGELIHALEAREGRGRVKIVDGDQAVGALDRYSVRRAVEDIMEGSEEAFRRRYAKYGF